MIRTLPSAQYGAPCFYRVFETTLRYLGGFLGTYDLAKALHGRDEPRSIEKATEVADMHDEGGMG